MPGNKIVIIGSGLGALVCGAILSREGYQITILEMNKQIGGTLQTFSRDRHIFDTGVHYIGGLSKGQNLYKVFKFLNIIDKLSLEQMDVNGFDKIFLPGDNTTYCLAQGYDNFQKKLTELFPNECSAIEHYCHTIRDICNHFPLYNLRIGTSDGKSKWLEIGAEQFIDSLTSNFKLKQLLAGNNMAYAGVPRITPLYVHALVMNSYIESSWRVLDGGSKIASTLSQIIRQNNGKIYTKKKVVRLHVEDGIVSYAETDDGNQFSGDYFISGIHPSLTFSMIESPLIRSVFRQRIDNLENTISLFTLNITLHPEIILYEKCNYYCHLNNEVWANPDYNEKDWPSQYALYFSPDHRNNKYAIGLTILTYMKFDEVKIWADTYNTIGNPSFRGSDYETFKETKANKLIASTYERFPLLEKAIKNYYVSTPLTYRDYMGTKDGSVYGIAKNYNNPLITTVPVRTKINNLLLTGQNLNLHGILGVAMSALQTSSEFIGMENLLNKIEKAQHE